jgi:hypothetical protein
MSGDIANSWATPLATGFIYNIHWFKGLNFNNLAV